MDPERKKIVIAGVSFLVVTFIIAVVIVVLNQRKPAFVEDPGEKTVGNCRTDRFTCPDGSTVGRVRPACEFAPCPTVTEPATPIAPGEPEPGVMCTMDAKLCPDGSSVGRTGPNCEFAPCPGESATQSGANVSDLIVVGTPKPHALVRSPLRIEGKARGKWFFEATFPFRLVDGEGRELVNGHMTAEGDWMTEDFVPFRQEIMFSAPGTATGTLILMKSNASGLPEHDAKLEIPIRFTP